MNYVSCFFLGQQPAISTVINTRAVPLTEAYTNCIPCKDSADDTNSDADRPSSTYTLCGNTLTFNDTFGNAHIALMYFCLIISLTRL